MQKRLLTRFTTLALVAFAAAACQTVSMDFGGKLDRRSMTVKHHFFLWGLTSVQDVDVKEYCGNGIARIEEKNTPVDVILTGITYGIYVPRTSELFCRF